jgi:hypothetical protein
MKAILGTRAHALRVSGRAGGYRSPGRVMGPQAPSLSRRASTKQEKVIGQIRTHPAQRAKIAPSGPAEDACASWFCFPPRFSSARLMGWGLPTPRPARWVSCNRRSEQKRSGKIRPLTDSPACPILWRDSSKPSARREAERAAKHPNILRLLLTVGAI